MTVLLLLTICFCYFAFAVFIGKVIAVGNRPLTPSGGVAAFSSRAHGTSVRPVFWRRRVTAPAPLAMGFPQGQRGRHHVKGPS